LKATQHSDLKRKIKFHTYNLLLSILAVFIAFSTPLYDSITQKYVDESLKQAAVTYAATRTINATVSVLQNTSIEVGVGLGLDIAAGEMLDPINDATERFSDLLTMSIWVLGAQKIIYLLSKLPVFNIIILILSLMILFINSKVLKNILVFLVILRFFLPFNAIVSEYFNKNFFIPEIEKNLKLLKPFSKTVHFDTKTSPSEGFWSKFSSTVSNAKTKIDRLNSILNFYIDNADTLIKALISVASLYLAQFLLNVIILPLFLVYVLKNAKLE